MAVNIVRVLIHGDCKRKQREHMNSKLRIVVVLALSDTWHVSDVVVCDDYVLVVVS